MLDHPWLADLDHEKILEKSIDAPVKPTLSSDVFDVRNFDAAFTGEAATVSVVPAAKTQIIKNNASQFASF